MQSPSFQLCGGVLPCILVKYTVLRVEVREMSRFCPGEVVRAGRLALWHAMKNAAEREPGGIFRVAPNETDGAGSAISRSWSSFAEYR